MFATHDSRNGVLAETAKREAGSVIERARRQNGKAAAGQPGSIVICYSIVAYSIVYYNILDYSNYIRL